MMYLDENGNISIHAAREGGDEVISDKIAEANISIHAAREGGDFWEWQADCRQVRFQSTPPVKAATVQARTRGQDKVFQSTPPVKAATSRKLFQRLLALISIHAAREGGDGEVRDGIRSRANFNPRRP